MIEEFVDSVLIIDDKEEEIQDLKKVLEDKDIWVKYLPPDACNKKIKSRKLVFVDLHIDETAGDKLSAHISRIRKILQTIITTNNNSYGLIIWTNHIEEVGQLKNKIQSDTKYLKPLFIIGISKLKYLKDGYNNLLSDIKNELQQNVAANFFIIWSNLIKKGKDKAITSIFELTPDYQKQDKNLEFLLFKMGQSYTGIPFDKIDGNYPLSIDAVKAFNDLLISNINGLSEGLDFVGEKNQISFKTSDDRTIQPNTKTKKIGDELLNLFSELNSRILIDNINIQQDKIIPGNVYEIIGTNSKLKHPDLSQNAIPITIEMTPPCDFSKNRPSTFYPRVLSGYMMDLDLTKTPNGEKFYRELWPIQLEGKKNPQIIVFDFAILGFIEEKDLQDQSKYKLLFRVKDKLFADILQKMSAHTARLGLSIIR